MNFGQPKAPRGREFDSIYAPIKSQFQMARHSRLSFFSHSKERSSPLAVRFDYRPWKVPNTRVEKFEFSQLYFRDVNIFDYSSYIILCTFLSHKLIIILINVYVWIHVTFDKIRSSDFSRMIVNYVCAVFCNLHIFRALSKSDNPIQSQ